MARQWQIRRGTTLQNDEFTGAIGEVTMDTTNNTVRIHDGTTVGGIKIGDVANATKNQNASSLSTSIYDWVGTLEQYTTQNIATTHPEWVCYITDDSPTTFKPIRQEVSERNIGELVYTTVPVIDAGLHLADGTLLSGTGIYKDFYEYMADVYDNGHTSIFCSEADWQTADTNYGKCGKYVLDTTNQTIRLPKIFGFIEGTISEAEIGARTAAGLPNITGTLGSYSRSYNPISGAFSSAVSEGVGSGGAGEAGSNVRYTFNASASNSIYGNSDTVQPESIKLYTYVVIANADKTPVQIDIDNIIDDLENKADLNLANSSAITNCITEIPQDIKFIFNPSNNSITVKVGTKLYIPNGFEIDGITRHFDEYVVENDTTWNSIGNGTANELIMCSVNNHQISQLSQANEYCYSGDTAPTSTSVPHVFWYDTANNIIKESTDSGSTWTTNNISLPIGIVSMVNNVITGISQVFNGFGYIADEFYVLPGVKYLIPDGRNEDGSLKNISCITSRVSVCHDYDRDGIATIYTLSHKPIILRRDGSVQYTNWYWEQLEQPNFIDGNNINYWYNTETNKMWFYRKDTSSTIYETQQCAYVGKYLMTSNGITNFRPKYSFKALDYNDNMYIAHQAMPSSKYIDLTLGASNSRYTAPADGYFMIKWACPQHGWFFFGNTNTTYLNIRTDCNHPDGGMVETFFLAKKGDEIAIAYGDLTPASQIAETYRKLFRFVYAEGAQ